MSDSTFTVESMIAANKYRHERNHAEDSAKIVQVWDAVEALKGQGFDVEHSTWDATNITVEVTLADLPRVYRALGSVRVWFKDVAYDKVTGAALTDHVKVVLKPTMYPCVNIRYVKPLASISSSPKKCRIVTTSRVETSTQLVCDRA